MSLTKEQHLELERQLAILSRGVVEIIPEGGLREKLARSITSGKPLKVKLGLDPSAPDVHLGHTVVLRKMRQFQDLGHEIQLVIGDFTGRIGDPTGRSTTRNQMTDADIAANAATYVAQFSKVMDMKKAQVLFNSSWLGALNFSEVIKLSSQITVARMLERDDFSNRYKEGEPIYVHEFFYPLMQGYDSVALETDIELGGTEQKFNLLMGRNLQEAYHQGKQTIMTLPLLVGLDGDRKMSKSLGNYIGIDEEPRSIYGKVMSLPDNLLLSYYELATDTTPAEIESLKAGLHVGERHPRDAKMALAKKLVSMYHGNQAAELAESDFVAVFQDKTLPSDIPEALWEGAEIVWIVELITQLGLAPSNSEARRLVRGGAVRVDGMRIDSEEATITLREKMTVQAGKRKFVRIKL